MGTYSESREDDLESCLCHVDDTGSSKQMEERELLQHVSTTELTRSISFATEAKIDRNRWSEGEGFGISSPRSQTFGRRGSSENFRTRLFILLPLVFHVHALAAAAKDNRWLSSHNLVSSTIRISSPDLQNRQILEQKIQQAAFRQFDHHKTGRPYNVSISAPDISGDSIFQAIRLRVGSLKKYGVTINEFSLPRGCAVNPAPQRLLLVYARLGNTSLFQNLTEGFFLASPVLIVLGYDASNLSSTEQPEKLSVTSNTPISVLIQPLSSANSNLSCASFDENSTNVNYSARLQNACDVNALGAFALVSNSPINVSVPVPAPALSPFVSGQSHRSSKAWKIAVGSVIGGLALLVLLGFLAFAITQHRKNAKFAVMEHHADQGESLQSAIIRNSRAPAAGATRTQPTLESDYVL